MHTCTVRIRSTQCNFSVCTLRTHNQSDSHWASSKEKKSSSNNLKARKQYIQKNDRITKIKREKSRPLVYVFVFLLFHFTQIRIVIPSNWGFDVSKKRMECGVFFCTNFPPWPLHLEEQKRCKNFNYFPPILWPPVLLLFSLHSIEIHILYIV